MRYLLLLVQDEATEKGEECEFPAETQRR